MLCKDCGEQLCQWSTESGALYNLQPFSSHVFQTSVQNLKGSLLRFSLCSHLECDGRRSPTCLSVPGVKLAATGMTVAVAPLEPHLPGRGFKVVLTDGDVCEVTGKPRMMTVVLPCTPNSSYRRDGFRPRRAVEGTKESVCQYTVEFPSSQFGCPVTGGEEERPTLTAGEPYSHTHTHTHTHTR